MTVSSPTRNLPPWPRKRLEFSPEVHEVKSVLREHGLRSVCEDARCPNISECFARKEATFMILGEFCTRRCGFCAIPTGRPEAVDHDEARRLAEAVAAVGLRHVVITSVARDDLKDGGAGHFAACVRAVRQRSPDTTVEILTSDFKADEGSLATIAALDLQIFNHNMETTRRLHPTVRPQATYERSLHVLNRMKELRPDLLTKSGFMLGLGESDDEVFELMRDMRRHQIDILTIGQYMQPLRKKLDVTQYSSLERFKLFEDFGKALGFPLVLSGPYVRSSFGAAEAARALGVLRA